MNSPETPSSASGGTMSPTVDAADVVALAGALRAGGVAVTLDQQIACARAVAAIDVRSTRDYYWVARITLLRDIADLAVFDRVFHTLQTGEEELAPAPKQSVVVADAGSDRDTGGSGVGESVHIGLGATVRERLRHRRFADASDDELRDIARMFDELDVALPHRTSRRTRPGRSGVLDLARTLERAMATDGELVDRAWRQRRVAPRRLVVLLDVSGSMAPYSRALLRFAVAARRTAQRSASRRVEVFAFGTRLTRITEDLARRDVDQALTAAAERVLDWDGGTRIGDSVDTLVRLWGPRGVLRGSVVVICSDGLERGDTTVLRDAVARLARHAYRIVWVNPLAGDPQFVPVQRGMAAALDSVDALVAGHDFASVEALTDLLATMR